MDPTSALAVLGVAVAVLVLGVVGAVALAYREGAESRDAEVALVREHLAAARDLAARLEDQAARTAAAHAAQVEALRRIAAAGGAPGADGDRLLLGGDPAGGGPAAPPAAPA